MFKFKNLPRLKNFVKVQIAGTIKEANFSTSNTKIIFTN